jgi:transcriptional regulator with XRE-family HTH domain
MSTDTRGTPRTRALAAALRNARTDAGYRQHQLAEEMGVVKSLMSNWETGVKVPSEQRVSAILAILHVTGEARDQILSTAARANEPDWLVSGVPGLNTQLAGILECERSAERIVDWQPAVIPGLAQTFDYARSVIAAAGVHHERVEHLARMRLSRRAGLPKGVHLEALVGKTALYQPVNHKDTLLDQLDFLAELAAEDWAEVRVVPNGGPWHPGLLGPFLLYEFEASGAVVHLEHHRSGVFLYESADVAAYQTVAEEVRQAAMSTADSLSAIAEARERMSQ